MTYLTFSFCGHHSSVVSSAPTILQPWVRIPSTPSMLFFNLYWNCNEKRTKINKQEAEIGPFLKRLSPFKYFLSEIRIRVKQILLLVDHWTVSVYQIVSSLYLLNGMIINCLSEPWFIFTHCRGSTLRWLAKRSHVTWVIQSESLFQCRKVTQC